MDDFPEGQVSRDVQICPLPQFSELRSTSITVPAECTDGGNVKSQGAQVTAHTIANLNLKSSEVANQLCEKQIELNQMLNVPNYGQNNAIFGIQSNSLPISNICLPSSSHVDTIKQVLDQFKAKDQNIQAVTDDEWRQHQVVVADYLQRLQVTRSLQELIKMTMQTELAKKKRTEDEKIEHTQTNILNIPNVRNIHPQSENSFMNSDQLLAAINPNDLLHCIGQQENDSNLQTVLKVEQQVQTDLPKIEKKQKFRAKIGEFKININYDGTMVYCCPECNSMFPDKTEIEQHIQIHLQERKYQCKECGAMLKRKEHLDQHMRGHSDERPFKCSVCQKAFKRNEHLTRHGVIHSGTKDFPCTICQKAFSRKDHLNKHLQTHLGIRKNKMKEDSYYVEQKDTRLFDSGSGTATVPKREVSYIVKDGCLLKQEITLLQHIQNLQKNPNLLHTLPSFKEQVIKDGNLPQQAESGNMDGNSRFLMSS